MHKAITVAALASALAIGGATTATALHKDVELSLDGRRVAAGAFAMTVADVLGANGISLGAGDSVQPPLEAAVRDGQQIAVTYTKPVTLAVDGSERTLHTTATTVGELLAESQLPNLGAAWLSLPAGQAIPREGLTLTVSNPKQVHLKVAGKTRQLTTNAPTVAALLASRGLAPDADDRLRPAPETALTPGARVVLDLIDVQTRTRDEAVPFSTREQQNSRLWKGESRTLTAGKPGVARRSYRVTRVNGKVTGKVLLTETLLSKPSAAVVEIGTKTTANGVGLNLARAAMWDRIARCESSGNWHINTGNGYYGGLQFSLSSWRSNGGRDFAAYPHQASRAEQITVANRYYAKAGLRPWACKP